MPVSKPHKIWVTQCKATRAIRTKYGVNSAFDYLVGEKLVTFAEAAVQRPEFADELPQFVATVRRIFAPSELAEQFSILEHPQKSRSDAADDDDAFYASAAMLRERKQRLAVVKDLLISGQP